MIRKRTVTLHALIREQAAGATNEKILETSTAALPENTKENTAALVTRGTQDHCKQASPNTKHQCATTTGPRDRRIGTETLGRATQPFDAASGGCVSNSQGVGFHFNGMPLRMPPFAVHAMDVGEP